MKTKNSVSAFDAKTHLSRLLQEVQDGSSITITKRGKPVARLVPIDHKPGDNIFGWLRARGSIEGDIVSPALPRKAWETLKKWDALGAPPGPKRTGRFKKSHKLPRSRR